MTKNEIEKKLKKGDKEGIRLAFDLYYDKIYGYVYRHVNHRETAQDITSEVFLRMLEHLDNYRNYGRLENYLYVIAGNLCRDYYRKKRPLFLDEMEILSDEPGFTRTEEALMVKEGLKKLSEREREIIILRYYQELKIKDIAKITGLNLSTVKYHLGQGRIRLEKWLKGEGE